MDKATNGLRPPYPIPREAGAPRRRRKSLRQRFCDGIEAAVKAEPAAFAATKPRTMMGQMVKELVGIAAAGHCGQIKLVAAFLEEAEARRNAQIEDLDDSQGISAPEAPPEPKWDWSEDGDWDSPGQESEEAGGEEAEQQKGAGAPAEIMRKGPECGRHRVAEFDSLVEADRVQLGAVPGGGNGPAAPISGNFPPRRAPDNAAGTPRLGGRRVEA